VDFIDEQKRAPSLLAPYARLLESLLQIRHAGENRRHLFKGKPGFARQQPCNRRLARARRPPQDYRGNAPRSQHAAENAVFPRQVLLPHHISQLLRPQPVGERPWRLLAKARRFEKRAHQRNVICNLRPPRLIWISQ